MVPVGCEQYSISLVFCLTVGVGYIFVGEKVMEVGAHLLNLSFYMGFHWCRTFDSDNYIQFSFLNLCLRFFLNGAR